MCSHANVSTQLHNSLCNYDADNVNLPQWSLMKCHRNTLIKSSFKNKTINKLSINNNAALLHFKVTLVILLQTNCIMARMTDLMHEMILFCGDADAMGKFNPMARQVPAVLIRITATQSFFGNSCRDARPLSCNSIKKISQESLIITII